MIIPSRPTLGYSGSVRSALRGGKRRSTTNSGPALGWLRRGILGRDRVIRITVDLGVLVARRLVWEMCPLVLGKQLC
jgi:hypothetical protein